MGGGQPAWEYSFIPSFLEYLAAVERSLDRGIMSWSESFYFVRVENEDLQVWEISEHPRSLEEIRWEIKLRKVRERRMSEHLFEVSQFAVGKIQFCHLISALPVQTGYQDLLSQSACEQVLR